MTGGNPGNPRRSGGSRLRQFGLRAAAIALGLAVFPLLELLCFLGGWGGRSVTEDPFVGFAAIRPLFERTDDSRWWQTSPARRGFFEEDRFLVQKPADEFRIFVFGGSTVQGNPFSIETSFTRFLELALHQADPSRRWKVVNCGGISYASYRLLPLMQECLQYQPDLYIFCEGHNEFLEDITYADVRRMSPAISRAWSLASRCRSFRLLQQGLQRLRTPPPGRDRGPQAESGGEPADDGRPVLPREVDALLDHTGGLEAYHRDDQHAAMVVQHFRHSLERMAELCQQHQLPLLLIQPPTNLSDCPPFKAVLSADTSPQTAAQIRQLLQQAATDLPRDPQAAAAALQQATELDPRFAWSWYQLGHALLAAERPDEAHAAFVRARDEDVCPLRMTTPLESALQTAATDLQVPLLNAAALLEQQCPHGILSDHILVDHVHPSFGGHQQIAVAIVRWMLDETLLTAPDDEWPDRSQQQFETHIQSLDNLYFLKGRRRLQDLRGWAAGRSEGPPLIRKPRPQSELH